MTFEEFAASMGGRIARGASPATAPAMPRGRPASATVTGLPVQPTARGALDQRALIVKLRAALKTELAARKAAEAEVDRLTTALAQAQEAARGAWRGRGVEVPELPAAEPTEGEVVDVAGVVDSDEQSDPWGPDAGA